MSTDVIIVGAGLAGLVAAAELADRGKTVAIVDQEGPQNLGGQAHWSLGGLFMVDTPEQRRMGIKDSPDLARQDWLGSAQFDRSEDGYPRQWADAYLDFAATEMRPWLHGLGLRWFPVVGWAERGGSFANGHGNSVPRFHITWGTGPGVLAPFIARCQEHAKAGSIQFHYRHCVDKIDIKYGAATGVSGAVLADDPAPQGAETNRDVVTDFQLTTPSAIVASRGIGGNFELIKSVWPTDRLGPMPDDMLSGSSAIGPVEAFKTHGTNFVVADTLEELVTGMNKV